MLTWLQVYRKAALPCWHRHPSARPRFSNLFAILDGLSELAQLTVSMCSNPSSGPESDNVNGASTDYIIADGDELNHLTYTNYSSITGGQLEETGPNTSPAASSDHQTSITLPTSKDKREPVPYILASSSVYQNSIMPTGLKIESDSELVVASIPFSTTHIVAELVHRHAQCARVHCHSLIFIYWTVF